MAYFNYFTIFYIPSLMTFPAAPTLKNSVMLTIDRQDMGAKFVRLLCLNGPRRN